MKPSALYDAAADYLEQNGWTQGYFFAPEGDGVAEIGNAACLYGAISATRLIDGGAYDQLSYGELNRLVEPLLSLTGSLDAICLLAWNDQPERTATEVIDLLRHAAKLAAEKEALESC